MPKSKRYLALDFGTGNGVAMAGAFDGKILAVEPVCRFDVGSTSMLGVDYWDFPALLIGAKKGLAAFAARHGSPLAGVACNSWGADFGLLDKTGHLLSNPVRPRASQGDGVMAKLRAAIPDRSLYHRTGVKSRGDGTLFQLFSMALANSPLLDKAVTMLLMADLVSYFLSGTPVQEYTLATTTGMYDAESRDWSRDTILAAKIPPVMVPEIVAPATVIGPLLDEVAAECGLSAVPVIAPASRDTAGAMAATPAVGDDWLYIFAGNWSQVGVEVPAPVINDSTFAADFTNEGGIDGSVRLLKRIYGLGILERCFTAWTREDGREPDVGAILKLADSARPFARIVNPDDPRLSEAADMPAALGAILSETGQPAAESRADFARLCMDSLILSHRHAVTQLMEITGRKYASIHVVGWGAGVARFSQAIADATGIVVKAGPAEAKAIGNLLLQAMALGDIDSLAEAREVTGNSFGAEVFEPKGDADAWGEAYARFLKLA